MGLGIPAHCELRELAQYRRATEARDPWVDRRCARWSLDWRRIHELNAKLSSALHGMWLSSHEYLCEMTSHHSCLVFHWMLHDRHCMKLDECTPSCARALVAPKEALFRTHFLAPYGVPNGKAQKREDPSGLSTRRSNGKDPTGSPYGTKLIHAHKSFVY